MKFFSFKFIFLIVPFMAITIINAYYEVIALNIQKGKGQEKTEGGFRVITWNVNGPLDDEDDKRMKGILEEIERLDPDIMCFQDLYYRNFLKYRATLDSIFGYSDRDRQIQKKEPLRYWLYSKKPIRNFKQYKCISEIDTIGFDSLQLDEIKELKTQMPVFSAEVEMEPDKWILVFSVHLRSSAYSTARRSMEKGSSWWDGISLYLKNYKIGKRIRDYEADNLRIYLDSLEATDTPIIIAGDFNDWSGSYCINTIRSGFFNDAWWEGGFGYGITYDAWHLKLRLDHILYSNHFELEKVFVKKSFFSDHYPLICDLNN